MARNTLLRAVLVCLSILCFEAVALAQWQPGRVYWATGSNPFGVIDVTDGGDLGNPGLFTPVPDRNPGQLAWSQDLAFMYASQFSNNNVVAVAADGTVSVHATGIPGPTGLLMTFDGHLLVVSYSSDAIFDITDGGDFSNAPALVTGLSGPRNLVQLRDGRVMVADQSQGTVFDINYPAGGTLNPYATGLGTIGDIVETVAGRIFVSQYSANRVMEITGGGDFAGAAPFATGAQFMGLCEDAQGRLLAGELFGSRLFDITNGGDVGQIPIYGDNAWGGETGLDMVPQGCGDGMVAGEEECDDGPNNSDDEPDACRTDCTNPGCGDGVVDTGEDCDDGVDNSDDTVDACRTTCAAAGCGDGVVDTGESCDDGAANSDVAPDACRTTCAPASCGDGVTDGTEECDDGISNSDTVANACRVGCLAPSCGDGVVDSGEDCDEGADNGGDTCSLTCQDVATIGGCCSADKDTPGPEHLLFVALILMLTRRRRRVMAG